ncbi:glycosyltransferase 87 family protein [Actinokineospora diospyrosa]|uniref:glycosyltransferase 87 family protein n=1 Tax=Actinokineospora diospyrosa TaxID=103728 RepID=UPI0020A380FA|nr:glycosyltransferase 87 family protein [Actinokineospora diospyrosa]
MVAVVLTCVVLVIATMADPVDLAVYRSGAEIFLGGRELYGGPVNNGLLFTYPPFSAIVFTPLALLSLPVAQVVVVLLNGMLLALIAHRCAGKLWPLVTAAAVLTEAVHTSLNLGQVNLLLLALVLLAPRWGTGVAAGIKLTPVIFVGLLLVQRRFRDALIATCVGAATVALGFAVMPADSVTYWLRGTFADSTRVFAEPGSSHNQSLRGLLLRAGVESPAVWIGLAVVVVAAALVVAAKADHVLGVAVVGMAGATVSPWSWGHHWVWLVPLIAVVVRELAARKWVWLVPVPFLLATPPPVLALVNPLVGTPVITGGPLHFLLGNAYVLVFLATLLTVALSHPALAAQARSGEHAVGGR